MDLFSRNPPSADHRIHYGPGKHQFGDLWLPAATRMPPLLVLLHGGWWKSGYNLAYTGHFASALRDAGVAVWSLEYRCGGDGGGWPTTFTDVAAGYDYIEKLAQVYPLDLDRVVAAGHSAGGHLAFWLAGRHHVLAGSPISEPQPRIPLRAAIGLAGAVDLQLTIDISGHLTFAHDREEVYTFMGGTPSEQPERYLAGDPGHLLPFNIPQLLIQGSDDNQIPPSLPRRWAEKAQAQGDEVTVSIIRGADHFDVVDPQSRGWPPTQSAILNLLRSLKTSSS